MDRQWRPGRVAVLAIGLLLAERLLVGGVGSPMVLARTLLDLGHPWADPTLSMLALMALVAEALAGYILLVLALGSLAALPGLAGRLAHRGTRAMTPAVARRLVDLLVGGTLIVQVAVAAPNPSPGRQSRSSCQAVATWSVCGRPGGLPATGHLAAVDPGAAPGQWLRVSEEAVAARPTARRSAVPLPPWLGGGPSKPAPRHRAEVSDYTVEPGDTLWGIAAAHLVPVERTTATIHRYWHRVYRANRRVVGADPDLIHPGTHLEVAPFRRDHR